VLRAEETAEDLYEAIDLCRDDLQRQVKKYKGRLQDKSQKAQRPGKPNK
jgi:putative sigma-54 modulation protein